MAGLRQGECSRQSIKELYKVLAAFNTDNGTFYAPKDKPYPLCFLSKCGKSLSVSKVCFCRGFGGCGNDAINVCKKSVKFQPCAITRKPSCKHVASFYIESIGISMQNIVVHISLIYYCSALKLAVAPSHI